MIQLSDEAENLRPGQLQTIFCGSDCKTVKQKKIHKLFRICEKPMAQKLLNVAMLFKDHVYIQTVVMCEVCISIKCLFSFF